MILAAGEGTRLRPLTVSMPKPMVPVAGRPLLEHTIRWLRHYGITRLAINLHHCPEAIPRHFGNGSDLGVEITYSHEEVILGTAGGAKRLAGFLMADEPFVLVYGDVLTDLDLGALLGFHRGKLGRPRLTMSLYHVPKPSECGIVRLDDRDRVVDFVEKPRPEEAFSDLANAGILVLEPEILQYVPDDCNCDFGRDVFPRLLAGGVAVYGWVLPESAFLLDIGSETKYRQARQAWPTRRAREFLDAGEDGACDRQSS